MISVIEVFVSIATTNTVAAAGRGEAISGRRGPTLRVTVRRDGGGEIRWSRLWDRLLDAKGGESRV